MAYTTFSFKTNRLDWG